MAAYQLRPMSLGEIVDGSLTLLRQHLGLFFGLSVVCMGVPTLLVVAADTNILGGGDAANMGYNVLGRLLEGLGYLLLNGATIFFVSEMYLGRERRLGEALRFGAGKMGSLFIVNLAAGIIVMLGLVLLVIPGIIAACGLAVTSQAVVLEILPASTNSISRSWALTKGFKGKVFLLALVMFALFACLLLGLVFGVALLTAFFKAMVLPATLLMVLLILMWYPFTSCVLTLLYYDLKVRKEGFDLELLSQQLGNGGAALPSTP